MRFSVFAAGSEEVLAAVLGCFFLNKYLPKSDK